MASVVRSRHWPFGQNGVKDFWGTNAVAKKSRVLDPAVDIHFKIAGPSHEAELVTDDATSRFELFEAFLEFFDDLGHQVEKDHIRLGDVHAEKVFLDQSHR